MSGRLTTAKRQALEALVLDIHRAAIQPDHWETVGQSVLSLIGGSRLQLVMADFGSDGVRLALSINSTEAEVERYQREFFAIDELTSLMDRYPVGVASLTQDLISEREWRGMPVYDAFYRGVDLHHFCVANIEKRGHHNVWISAGRSYGEALFDPADRETMQMLVPHLRQAYVVARELATARLEAATGIQLFNQLGTGCVVLDRHGRAIHFNAAFEQCLRDGVFSLHCDSVQFASRAANAAWRKTLAGLAGSALDCGRAFSVHARNDQYFVRMTRFDFGGHWDDLMLRRPFALAFISHAAPGREPSALIADAFGLTETEAQVLVALMGDSSPKSIAADRGVSEETVRFHIRNLYRKTDTRGQLALINKVQRLLRRFATVDEMAK